MLSLIRYIKKHTIDSLWDQTIINRILMTYCILATLAIGVAFMYWPKSAIETIPEVTCFELDNKEKVSIYFNKEYIEPLNRLNKQRE